MKKIFLFKPFQKVFVAAFLLVSSGICMAQNVAVNNNGANAHPSAMLDVTSTTKGFLSPRMTSAQRLAIPSPAEGLSVYDTDTKTFWYFSTSWKEINLNGNGGGGSFSLPYSGIYADPGKLFSINNTDSSNGTAAVYGRSGLVGTGITPGINAAVWGDNLRGVGVLGTSVNGIGASGFSFQNHGVSGYTTNNSFAGVYGSHADNGAGVMGTTSSSGMGIYGTATGIGGKAGMFESTNSNYADSVLVVKNAGFGLTGIFTNTNAQNGNSVVSAVSNAKGDGFYAEMNNTSNTPNAAFRGINNSLGGYGLYAESGRGVSARLFNSDVTNNSFTIDAKTNGLAALGNFIITNASNNNYILQGSTTGTGGGLNLSLTNIAATGTGINVAHSGTGTGLVVASKKGKAGVFSNTDATNGVNVLDVSTIGTGNAAVFTTNNAANSTPSVKIDNIGTGRGVQSILTNANNTSAAVFGFSAGNRGVEGFAQTYGVVGQSGASTGGTGVIGLSSANSADGIGVKGVSWSSVTNSGAVTAINNGDGVGLYASSAGSNGNGVGVSAIGSGNNSTGVYTEGKKTALLAINTQTGGTFGYGVVGETGNNGGTGVAGKFVTNNINDPSGTLMALNYGKGEGLSIVLNNNTNSGSAIYMNHTGTGRLLSLFGQNNSHFYVNNNGNLATTGTVTVHGDKGIVRNSSSTQMRVETLTASLPAGGVSLSNGSYTFIDVTFSTPFSSPPVVYVANITSQNYFATFLIPSIMNVTTTGCQFNLRNTSGGTMSGITGTWKLVAMGAE